MWSRECAYAIAEGDSRWLYEILKVDILNCVEAQN
jgi:hypothetical protein